jgi:pimeloyl-ACP methyl ester carboxylesterase
MVRGEVSITGGSLGGLTSCYAASKYPQVFARAVCSSPSNCYNFGNGGLASVIASNYAASGKAPKAVIQFLGAEALSGDGRADGDEYQMQHMLRDDAAWQSIGLAPVTFESVYTPDTPDAFGFHRAKPLPDRIVMSLILPGGQHAPPTWQQTLAAALPIMYRADRPDKTRIPKSESLAYYSLPAPTATPPDSTASDSSSDFSLSAGEVAACVIVPTVVTIASLVAYFSLVLKPQLLQGLGDQTISKEVSPFQRNL